MTLPSLSLKEHPAQIPWLLRVDTDCVPNQSPEGMPLLRVHHLRLLPSDSSQVHVLSCYPSLKLRRPVWLSYCTYTGRGQNMENAELVKKQQQKQNKKTNKQQPKKQKSKKTETWPDLYLRSVNNLHLFTKNVLKSAWWVKGVCYLLSPQRTQGSLEGRHSLATLP